jgi:two-component system, chemotaxis family, protein-glutamate methylesterase/glutaminase
MSKKKILVVDDSPFIRRILSDWFSAEADLELVGAAKDGNEAIEMAHKFRPDVITMDVEMPHRDGLSALSEIMRERPVPVIMVSSITTQGAQATMKALELGAVDFVTKPEGSSSLKVIQCKSEILAKIRASFGAKLNLPSASVIRSAPRMVAASTDKVVVIASSTGGPKALATLWASLPKGFPAPILIVQHMPAGFTETFARRLDSMGTVPCKEAAHGDRILPGMALLAPGDFHMTVNKNHQVELNQDPNMHGTRPAADPMFLTALKVYGGSKLVGAVLTGMGKDGAEGARAITHAGGTIYGQNEETCTIYGMPKAALQAGGITAEYPIEEIGSMLVQALSGRLRNAS